MKKLTKEEEKSALTVLWNGQGYFADYFNEKELLVMLANIDNDIPLLVGTNIDLTCNDMKEGCENHQQARHQLMSKLEEAEEELLKLRNEVIGRKAEDIQRLEYLLFNDLEEAAVACYGEDLVIEHKVRNHLPLTDAEAGRIIQLIENYHQEES